MSQGTFKKVGQSGQRLYGPRAMLVCGFSSAEQEAFMELTESLALVESSVVFVTADDGSELLGDLLNRPDQSGRNAEAGLSRAVILSGITENELQLMLSTYRQAGLPRPLWATLTPVSEKWTLSRCLQSLSRSGSPWRKEAHKLILSGFQ